MDLFDHARQEQITREAPLAARMRPRTLNQFVGQEHIIGPGRLLRRAIQADQISSVIFFGPPGTGKTTLARVIANTTQAHFIAINAVLAGVKDIREAIAVAQEKRGLYGQRTILFVDEVHRFNKAQQDALLPHVENGTIILIGATTENPYFEVIKALVSRSRIFELHKLTPDDLRQIAHQALDDPERGYGKVKVRLDHEALDHLVDVANGDARSVLNALELAIGTTPPLEDGSIVIDLAVAEESIQRRAVLYDKDGDAHFDTISAFIKSLRGSDPDAALYWMARMIYAGEAPRFIFRRMLIFAGEDVGLADPNAIQVVAACAQAFDYVGMPEGRFHLAQACIYLATASKSNSTFALFDAIDAVEKEQEEDAPDHLKDANRDGQDFGHGQGYLYPHAYRDHWVAQQYLPDNLQGKLFYQPGDQGYEARIRDQVARRREAQLAAVLDADFSPVPLHDDRGHEKKQAPARISDHWLQRTLSAGGEQLQFIRERIMTTAGLERHSLVLDLNATTGLLTWEAIRRVPTGGVWALVGDEKAADALRQQASRLDALLQPVIVTGRLKDLQDLINACQQDLETTSGKDEAPKDVSVIDADFNPTLMQVRFNAIVGRNVLTRCSDRKSAAQIVTSLLASGGMLSLAEVIPHRAQRLYKLLDLSPLDGTLRQRLIEAEEAIYTNPDDPMVSWDSQDLEAAFEIPGLSEINLKIETLAVEERIEESRLANWFRTGQDISTGQRPSYAYHLSQKLSIAEIAQVQALFERQLRNQTVQWKTEVAFLSAHQE